MTDSSPTDIDPLGTLAAQVAAIKAEKEKEANEPVTIADVAAAAFVALETIIAVLPQEARQHVIDEFEQRAATFAASMEAGE